MAAIDLAQDPPPADAPNDKSPAQRLQESVQAASVQYSVKNYGGAADLYSEAAALQDEVNGEMSPKNADLLYQYGRCLYHVAVAKSDVLGGKVAGAGAPAEKPRKKAKIEGSKTNGHKHEELPADANTEGEVKMAEEVVEAAVDEKTNDPKPEKAAESQPFFNITGDENWTDSEDEDDAEDGEAGDEPAEEEDDFANAYEILDVARVLLSRQMAEVAQGDSKGKGTTESPEVRQLKERLADTHDLQAEISLENERFADAVTDSKQALALKVELYPTESSLIAEAHYKLSLALEFASVTAQKEENGEVEGTKAAQVDEGLRTEAATEMEAAIQSCKLRVTKEEQDLPSLDTEEAEKRRKSIKDVKDMIDEMEQRLVDLRNPAVSVNDPTGPAGAPDGNPLGGLLGQILGESPAQQRTRIEEATKSANDLTGFVKHKKQPKKEASTTGEKRKGEHEEIDSNDIKGKKARVETVPDAGD